MLAATNRLRVSSNGLSLGKGVSDLPASKLSGCMSNLVKTISRVLLLAHSEATLMLNKQKMFQKCELVTLKLLLLIGKFYN